MIDPAYAQLMARYDRWQNASLIRAAATLTDAQRWADRGAFFGSIAATLNHILWDHRVWLARQSEDTARAAEINARHPCTEAPRRWRDYVRERHATDAEIARWCAGLTAQDMMRQVRWMRGADEVETSFAANIVHMFNHATHHRGQVHGMLTGFGVDPGPTDLPMLPGP